MQNSGRDEYAVKAGGYLSSRDRLSAFFDLKLAHLIFSATKQLSVTLQAMATTMQDAVECSKPTTS